jgi:hypothetical protein
MPSEIGSWRRHETASDSSAARCLKNEKVNLRVSRARWHGLQPLMWIVDVHPSATVICIGVSRKSRCLAVGLRYLTQF